MISEAALNSCRNWVAKAFAAGMPHFPFYTLHGAEHLKELDRLARLFGPDLELDEERLNLLRMALILHDFALAKAPDRKREKELRSQMDPTRSFADIVRKTHQDEILGALSDRENTRLSSRNL